MPVPIADVSLERKVKAGRKGMNATESAAMKNLLIVSALLEIIAGSAQGSHATPCHVRRVKTW
jgi:hypothetical protein